MDALSSVTTHTRPDGSRSIRSYIRRQGRITRAQARARTQLGARYGVEIGTEMLDAERVFGRVAPLVVEIGFGMGHALIAEAQRHPDWNFIGIDVYRAGVGALLAAVHARTLTNVRVIEADAVDVFERAIVPQSVATLMVYFPDPWPKKRHHKRRLVCRAFLDLVASGLAPGARVLIATDWNEYALEMLDALRAHPLFVNVAPTDEFAPRPPERPMTRFEERGLGLGHQVFDLTFARV